MSGNYDTGTLFRSRDRAKQLISFDNLRFGRGYPTDVDAMLDLGGQCFVFIECKAAFTDMPTGQRKALERLVKAIKDVPCLLLLVEHDRPLPEDIDLGACKVRKFLRNDGKSWQDPLEDITCRQAVIRFALRMAPDVAARLGITDPSQTEAGNDN